MLFILRHSDLSTKYQRELRNWLFDNGLLHSELLGPVWVDSVAQVVTVAKKVPKAGQEGADFPEFTADANGEPITVEQVLPLSVRPLGWMYTMTGAWYSEQVRAGTFAMASR